MPDTIILQISPTELAIGLGPFTFNGEAPREGPAFYINDFFLEKQKPWVCPKDFNIVSIARAKRDYQINEKEQSDYPVSWRTVDESTFKKTFATIQDKIGLGEIIKCVPALFEEGTLLEPQELFFKRLIHNALNNPAPNLFLYAYLIGDSGGVGLTPELLFSREENWVVTAALAGTKSSRLEKMAVLNPKDQREHSLVVDDLNEKLSRIGSVRIKQTEPHAAGQLCHLRTVIEASIDGAVSFDELVKLLHPSAALGVYPMNESTMAFLKEEDQRTKRDYFGSPIGYITPFGKALCVIMIRGVQWTDTTVRLGSGCGVIKESTLEDELHELSLKRGSIKQRLFS